MKLEGGPFAGAEVRPGSASLNAEGPGVPEGHVARYRYSTGLDAYVFERFSKIIILRVPTGGEA